MNFKKTPFTAKMLAGATVALAIAAIAGCHSVQSDKPAVALKDGEPTLPQSYQNWPKFVNTVDKKSGHVREIYMNPIGHTATKGEAFPAGTVSVMEIYLAKKDAGGNPVLGDDGRMMKDALEKVFIMEKGAGWGAAQPEGTLDNGDWVYAAYLPDGSAATDNFAPCRACHLPLVEDDYVHRYDEHFQ